LALTDPETRENALLDLSKKRDLFPDLAPILWHSFGVIPALLQEIIAIYPLLSPPALTAHASNRVCNALALLQCVASHQETRSLFLSGTAKLIILFISLKLLFKWRVNRLGVIGALVKVDDTDVINFLLSTEIIPLCLRTMELGSEVRFLILYLFYLKIN
jgi:CCR4-NOT transcription complex subunit 9